MKKAYSTPEIEKINFQYRDQVVVASAGTKCPPRYTNIDNSGDSICDTGDPEFAGYAN